jgi:hypothetical protein
MLDDLSDFVTEWQSFILFFLAIFAVLICFLPLLHDVNQLRETQKNTEIEVLALNQSYYQMITRLNVYLDNQIKSDFKTNTQIDAIIDYQLSRWYQENGIKGEDLEKAVGCNITFDPYPDMYVQRMYDNVVVVYLDENFSMNLASDKNMYCFDHQMKMESCKKLLCPAGEYSELSPEAEAILDRNNFSERIESVADNSSNLVKSNLKTIGRYLDGWQEIRVSIGDLKTMDGTFIHEQGHYVSYRLLSDSEQDEWVNVTAFQNNLTTYSETNADENFAENYVAYCYNTLDNDVVEEYFDRVVQPILDEQDVLICRHLTTRDETYDQKRNNNNQEYLLPGILNWQK